MYAEDYYPVQCKLYGNFEDDHLYLIKLEDYFNNIILSITTLSYYSLNVVINKILHITRFKETNKIRVHSGKEVIQSLHQTETNKILQKCLLREPEQLLERGNEVKQ